MKKLVSSVLGFCLAALLFASLSYAQQRDVITFHLSQPALATGETLPAGDYQVRELDTANGVPVLLLQSGKFSLLVAAARVPDEPSDFSSATKLVFERRGDSLELSKICLEGRDYHYQLAQD